MSKFNYEFDEDRELDYKQSSIAIQEMSCILVCLAHSRNEEVDFHKYIAYAKQLQRGLYKIESELKKRLRESSI